ncbi:helix-turn-helix domain-containing protein [Wolbachia endosymbiont of Folsomia candida]|uniref:helix-turn-helix domain-containing protein n=1 Tax=Wolbachia endosymbiont of Folsomia candida TaxID=169402 RepID=UPI000A41F771|nr:helix-turn-helix transcriptional regulator [Wolbachia endosymbiont of Folsomia candida]APR98474.1 XRE family transcriptional regulator [Wolbachia endosymbiont of Folsomia candida]
MEIISLNSLDSTEIKRRLIDIINSFIEKYNWTQSHAAEILGIDQPKVSQIKNGKIDGFSLERLLSFLKKLDHEIIITMKESESAKFEAEKFKHKVESE